MAPDNAATPNNPMPTPSQPLTTPDNASEPANPRDAPRQSLMT